MKSLKMIPKLDLLDIPVYINYFYFLIKTIKTKNKIITLIEININIFDNEEENNLF